MLPAATASNPHPRATTRAEQATWTILALHALSILLYVAPWYHPGYRWTVNLANLLLLLITVLAVVSVLLPRYCQARRLWPLVACLGITAALMAAAVHRHDWRVAITGHWIQAHHCAPHRHPPQKVLGGLKRVGGLSEGERVFVNDTHCLTVNCAEEFYECTSGPHPPATPQP